MTGSAATPGQGLRSRYTGRPVRSSDACDDPGLPAVAGSTASAETPPTPFSRAEQLDNREEQSGRRHVQHSRGDDAAHEASAGTAQQLPARPSSCLHHRGGRAPCSRYQTLQSAEMTATCEPPAPTEPTYKASTPDPRHGDAHADQAQQRRQRQTEPRSRSTPLNLGQNLRVGRGRRPVPEAEVAVRDERSGHEDGPGHPQDRQAVLNDRIVETRPGATPDNGASPLHRLVGTPHGELNRPTVRRERTKVRLKTGDPGGPAANDEAGTPGRARDWEVPHHEPSDDRTLLKPLPRRQRRRENLPGMSIQSHQSQDKDRQEEEGRRTQPRQPRNEAQDGQNGCRKMHDSSPHAERHLDLEVFKRTSPPSGRP